MRIAALRGYLNPHYFSSDLPIVDLFGEPLESDIVGCSPAPRHGNLRLNHHLSKSREDFQRKVARGRATTTLEQRDASFFDYYHRNEVPDLIAAGLAQQVRSLI